MINVYSFARLGSIDIGPNCLNANNNQARNGQGRRSTRKAANGNRKVAVAA